MPLVALALASPAGASVPGAVVQEPIPPDPREDLAMHVVLEGDLPAALQTPTGVVAAPDPREPPSPRDATYGATAPRASFEPDHDTREPDVNAYDEPFTPPTAPYKRAEVFDAVREDYQLTVRDTRLQPVPSGAPPGLDDLAFYESVVVDLAPHTRVRIPSVGPDARLVEGRLGAGAQDFAYRVQRDGADNWYLEATGLAAPVRARAVMEVAVARGASGAQLADRSWGELPLVAPLPDNVARDAAQVRAAIGVSRAMRPRQAIEKLAQYFGGFAPSDEPPSGRRSVYLDLALSKKGVCRHRAYAFLVTAQSLGIPTRFVENEVHAWVEVHDGTMWRRIDLGGAGRMRTPRAEAAAASDGGTAESTAAAAAPAASANRDSGRPAPVVTVSTASEDVRRGAPLRVRGEVRARGEACQHVRVEVSLTDRTAHTTFPLGVALSGDDGTFDAALVVPSAMPLGDYDVVAQTPSDARCGSSN